jgi:hypothetical protein
LFRIDFAPQTNYLLLLTLVFALLGLGLIMLRRSSYRRRLTAGYTSSLNTDVSIKGQLDSSSYLTLAVIGLANTVAGTGMFIRYSLAKFLRFWLLREPGQHRAVGRQALLTPRRFCATGGFAEHPGAGQSLRWSVRDDAHRTELIDDRGRRITRRGARRVHPQLGIERRFVR